MIPSRRHEPTGGSALLTAATPMDSPYCSCELMEGLCPPAAAPSLTEATSGPSITAGMEVESPAAAPPAIRSRARRVALCSPELKVRSPAHTKHPGWYVEFESRVGVHRRFCRRASVLTGRGNCEWPAAIPHKGH